MNKKIISKTLFSVLCTVSINAWASDSAQLFKDFWINIENDRPSQVQEALRAGFDPNALSPNRVPAIMEAVKEGSWKVYNVLLKNPKLNLNNTAAGGESLLMYVLLTGDITRAKDLIARGAAVNKPGWTPLHFAALSGKSEGVALLLDLDAYIDAESDMKVTPLMFAMKKGNIQSVKLLLDAGADVDVKDYRNWTALDYALDAGNTDLAKMFKEYVQVKRR